MISNIYKDHDDKVKGLFKSKLGLTTYDLIILHMFKKKKSKKEIQRLLGLSNDDINRRIVKFKELLCPATPLQDVPEWITYNEDQSINDKIIIANDYDESLEAVMEIWLRGISAWDRKLGMLPRKTDWYNKIKREIDILSSDNVLKEEIDKTNIGSIKGIIIKSIKDRNWRLATKALNNIYPEYEHYTDREIQKMFKLP